MYMPEVPWVWTKAQTCQESRFDPNAVSPVKASGLLQIMPGTWKDLEGKHGIKGNVFSPSLNIQLGSSYMKQMRGIWNKKKERTHWQIHELALASYNSGAGNVLQGQKKCGNALLWKDISPCQEMITGKKFSHETRTYVQRIDQYITSYEDLSRKNLQWSSDLRVSDSERPVGR